MGLADREWRLIPEEVHEGAINMALDEVAADTAATGGPRTLRVYRWEPSTLSLGYHQDSATVDWAYCEREGITVTRRPTGGGGIYHDTVGDISYSIVAPADELPGDLMDCYRLLLEPIFDAFERMGVPVTVAETARPAVFQPACYLRELHTAHDVVVGDRKISGNAQYRRKDAVIQHGSLTFALEPSRHLGVFAGHGVTPARFKDRVTSIREHSAVDRDEAVMALESALATWARADVDEWRPDELEAAHELANDKFAAEDWTRRR